MDGPVTRSDGRVARAFGRHSGQEDTVGRWLKHGRVIEHKDAWMISQYKQLGLVG